MKKHEKINNSAAWEYEKYTKNRKAKISPILHNCTNMIECIH